MEINTEMSKLAAANDLAEIQLVLAHLAEYGAIEVRHSHPKSGPGWEHGGPGGYSLSVRHIASSEPLSLAVLDAWVEEINSALVATHESMLEKFEVRRLEHYAKVTN